MFCTKCGAQIDPDARFCPSCGAGTQPGNHAQSEQIDRYWAIAAHLSVFVLWFLGPLIVLLVRGNESDYVKGHSQESLNFQITVFLCVLALGIVASLGMILAFLVLPAVLATIAYVSMAVVGIAQIILVIMGAIDAYNGVQYRYPISIRFIS